MKKEKTSLPGPQRSRRRPGRFRGVGVSPAALLLCLALMPLPVEAQPPISSASETDYPPFCIVDDQGRADGFSVELMRAALEAMGREVTFRTGTWNQVRGWLERGEVQALPLVGRTPEREAIFDFTFPYMSLHGAVVVREDNRDIRDLDDLRGRQVAVMKGDNAEEFLRREERGIAIHTTPTYTHALRELSQGRHDAVVMQRLVALRLLQETGLPGLRVLDRPVTGFRQDFCFAVKEGDRESLALLNEGLSLVMADGTYRHLHARWFAALQLPAGRRILVGGDHNYPPYEYLDEDGNPAGFVVDLTRAIAREVGLDIEIRLGPWSEVVRGLEQGDIDVVQGMFYSPERDLTFDFTQPHAVSNYVSVVRRGEGSPPDTVEELAGMRIVVQRGDFIHDFLAEKGLGDRVSVVETQEDVLREVAEGRYDCALAVRMSALYLIEQNGWTDLHLGQRPIFSAEYCYAVRDNQKALLASFSEGLKILEETGQYRRIRQEWLGTYEEQPLTLATALRYSAMVLVPLLVVLLAVLLWSWSLRRRVAARTRELRRSERLLVAIIDAIPAPVFYKDPQGVYLGCNRAFAEFLGLPKEEIVGKTAFEVAPGHLAVQYHDADAVFLAEKKIQVYEAEVEVGEGRLRRVVFHKAPFHGPDGTMRGIVGAILDITELKSAQQRIEHLNRVLRSIREVNQLIVRERDRDTLIREGCRLLVENRGYSAALIVLTDETDRPGSWAEAGMGECSASLDAMLERGELPPCCERARHPDEPVVIQDQENACGSCPVRARYAGAESLCVRLAGGGGAFGYLMAAVEQNLVVDEEERSLFAEMAEDLTFALRTLRLEETRRESEAQRASLEDRLIQAQKLESVGRLAGGVAHDYNNMLSVILGYAEMAMGRLSLEDPLQADLREILNAARRSADINRQLLAFARKQTISPRVLDLNETVGGMLKMLRRLIGEDIDLAWMPGADLWPVHIDPAQVDQILANLCVNARDAITGVGKITIETENYTFDEGYCAVHPSFVPGEFVLLAVSDDGCGMDRETLASIFEPFFTTKDVHEGTGLGLAMVYGIVKQNNGFINVYSEPGKGSTFKVYLPRHGGELGEVQAESAVEVPPGRGETVLLVEDEPAIMRMGATILEDLGYQVLAAGSPREALREAGEHAGGIHLLVTDVVMPEMNGRELADRVRALYPDVKVLFMSGYTANVIAHRGVLEEGVRFMPKPFTVRDLAVKVRAVLDGT